MKSLYQSYNSNISFCNFVGQEYAKLSLILNAVDPLCGGVIIIGNKGCGKSTLVRAFREVLPTGIPFVELPLNITEESLIGGVDIENALKTGKKIFKKGVIGRADKGIIYVEDINLLSEDILSILFETQSRGINIVQREGIELFEASRFIIIATMNSEESELSDHFLDRFGFCVYMDAIKNKDMRKKIIKTVLFPPTAYEDIILSQRIQQAKAIKHKLTISEEIIVYIEELLLKDGIMSHRADTALFYGARAYAAYMGDIQVDKSHVDKVYPLVVMHRKVKRKNQIPEELSKQSNDKLEKSHKGHEHKNKKNSSNDNYNRNLNKQNERKKLDNISGDADIDKIFPVGESFNIKRILFKKDRIFRTASGKRTKTKTKGQSGRYVKHVLRCNNDIAVDATIRASAPYQKRRGMTNHLIIKDEDLRFKQREKRMGHLFIFVVDGSGSMAAQKRIIEAKAAIQSILIDCYQRRDRVSMILFRKTKADLILPPTSSLEIAAQRLKDLPTGGATPLSAGLLEAYKVIRQSILKDKELRIVMFIITDGRANKAIKGDSPWEEVKKISFGLSSLSQLESIVVDTEVDGFLSMGLSKELAVLLDARYMKIEDLKQQVSLFLKERI